MGLKDKFLLKDRLVRGITEDGFFKVAVIKATDVVKSARERHKLSLLGTVILGRTLTGAMLLASDLKGEERVQLRLEGSGPLKAVIAEANQVGEIRGYVANPEAELDYTTARGVADGLGIGLLTFTKVLFNEAAPVSGIVELQSGNVDEDIAFYLTQSEQVPSAVKIDVGIDEEGGVEHAVGVMVQALPGAPLEQIAQIEANFKGLESLSSKISKGDYIDDLMEQVVGPYPVRELTRYPVHFYCRCDRERFKTALGMLGMEELRDLVGEKQTLVCHYCSEVYEIESEEIEALVKALN